MKRLLCVLLCLAVLLCGCSPAGETGGWWDQLGVFLGLREPAPPTYRAWASVVTAGASTYGYLQLSEKLQRTYRDLRDAILTFQPEVTTPAVEEEHISRVISYLNRDLPAVFWLSDKYQYAQRGKNTVITLEFLLPEDEVATRLAAVETASKGFLAAMSRLDEEYDKALKCYNMVVNHVEYVLESENQHDLYGALCERKASCEGYAKMYQYLLRRGGIECLMVYGEAEKVPHAWNMVALDNRFYIADPTWGDQKLMGGRSFVNHEYLFLDDITVRPTHSVDRQNNYPLPACGDTRYRYVAAEGLLLTSANPASWGEPVKRSILQAMTTNNPVVELGFENSGVYYAVKQEIETGELDRLVQTLCRGLGAPAAIGRMFNERTNTLTYVLAEE